MEATLEPQLGVETNSGDAKIKYTGRNGLRGHSHESAWGSGRMEQRAQLQRWRWRWWTLAAAVHPTSTVQERYSAQMKQMKPCWQRTDLERLQDSVSCDCLDEVPLSLLTAYIAKLDVFNDCHWSFIPARSTPFNSVFNWPNLLPLDFRLPWNF